MSVFDDLARQPGAEIVVAIDLRSADPLTGEYAYYRVTDAASLHTLPTDTPANATYRNMLVDGGVRTTRALTERPEFTGKAPPNRASFAVYNGTGALGAWRQQRWVGQPVLIRAGGERTAAGQPYPFSEFVPYFTGTLRGEPTGETGQVVRFECVGATTPRAEQPVVEEVYRAFGGAVRLPPPNADMTATGVTLTAPLALEWIGRVDVLPFAAGGLVRYGNGAKFGIRIKPDGTLTLWTTGNVFTDAAYVVEAGQELYVYAGLGADLQTVTMYAGRDGRDIRQVLSATVPTVDLSTDIVRFGRIGVLNPAETFDCTVYEARILATNLTLEEAVATADSPVDDPSGYVEVWKMNDGVPPARGENGLYNLTLANGSFFVSSYEGDDPIRGGSLLGTTKPRAWGAPFNVPTAWLDSQVNVAQWSSTPSGDVIFAKLDGGKLMPKLSFEAANYGDFSWDGDGPTGGAIVILPGLGFDFRRFVPGQEDPVVFGQLVDLFPNLDTPPGYQGSYRVFEVSEDGLRVDLVDIHGAPITGKPDATFLAMTTFESSANEPTFEVDLIRSAVILGRSPGGELTVDPIAEGGPSLLASDAFASVAKAPVISRVVVDPVVGFYVTWGEDVTVGDLLDEIAVSCFGWRAEDRNGGHVLGSYRVPSGPAVAALIGSTAADLESRGVVMPPVVARIESVQERPATPPVWQVRVGYDKNWTNLSKPVGVLSEVDRQRMTTTWREVQRPFPAVRRVPGTKPMPEPLPTYIVGRDDAVAVTDQLAAPLLSVERRWLDFDVSGLPLLALELGSVVLVEHPDEDFGIAEPTFGTVWRIEEDTASDLIAVGVYL